MDWLDLLAVRGNLKNLLQHHSSKASILQHSAFFMVQFSYPYMTTGKTTALPRWTFAEQQSQEFEHAVPSSVSTAPPWAPVAPKCLQSALLCPVNNSSHLHPSPSSHHQESPARSPRISEGPWCGIDGALEAGTDPQ